MVFSSIGYGEKSDFTKEKRYIPAPNQYSSPQTFF